MSERMRIQKFLSRAGAASRRHGEELMQQGRVRVNGRVADELGSKVDPETDTVELDGERVELAPPAWIALHKPPGYVSTRDDPHGRPTIYDLVPKQYEGLFHVGRLDQDSEGLLLLTNQGNVANRLLHPRYETDRVYDVTVEGEVTAEQRERLREGVELRDGEARAAAVEPLAAAGAPGTDRLRVTIREGRKREVRRMFRALGHPVRRLVRLRIGPVRLGDLASGEWRHLTEDEIAALPRKGGG